MPSLAICDASVAVRWLVDDPLSAPAIRARDRYDLIAPWLLMSETANALRNYVKAGVLPLERINEAFDLMHAGESIRSVVVF